MVSAGNIVVMTPSHRCVLSLAAAAYGDEALWSRVGDCDVAIGFAPPPGDHAVEWREIDASMRLEWPAQARRIALVGLQSLTSLGPVLLWDLAHACPVGGEIVLVDQESVLRNNPLDRLYYGGWLALQDAGGGLRVYRKTAPAPAEADGGLDRWSFCLPVDRPDIGFLERLVERVAGLGLAQTEILVACPVEHHASLPAGVRAIAAPPDASLGTKKNLLADSAALPNLCIFHDRLLPPRNFAAAAKAFGDHYPLCGLQNLAINPETGAISRYSDYHVEIGATASQAAAVDGAGRDSGGLYADLLHLRQSWRSRFVEASIFEYSENAYLTGSLYLSKRSVWRTIRQDESIEWACLEDVEFGHRAIEQWGAPMRINPFAFARTERVRLIMTQGAEVQGPGDFATASTRPGPAADAAVKAPPALGLSESDYRGRLLDYCAAWAPPENMAEARRRIAGAELSDMRDLAHLIVSLLHLSVVRRTEAEIGRHLAEFSRLVLVSPMDHATIAMITGRTMSGRSLADEIIRCAYVTHMLLAGERGRLFSRQEPSQERRLVARLAEVWRDRRHGLGYRGAFPDFVEAVRAAL